MDTLLFLLVGKYLSKQFLFCHKSTCHLFSFQKNIFFFFEERKYLSIWEFISQRSRSNQSMAVAVSEMSSPYQGQNFENNLYLYLTLTENLGPQLNREFLQLRMAVIFKLKKGSRAKKASQNRN